MSTANTIINKGQILHPCTSITALENAPANIIKSAKGIYIKDKAGNELLDGIAGLWCSNLGHGRTELAEAMSNSLQNLDYFHTFNGLTNTDQIELSERLIEMAPDSLSHVFFGCSGSDANDTLIKIAWQYQITRGKPEKRKVISRWQAYHGTSISTASLTGLKGFHKAFNLPLDFALHTETPHYYRYGLEGESEQDYTQRLLQALRNTIEENGADNIAAFIGEPIMGAGGVITPPQGYWQGVQTICKEYDILLIADEVVCGYGRTGTAFGSDHYDLKPDMMATAKGLTSGVFPMSAAFISQEIHDVLRLASSQNGSFLHGYTYSGHPIGAAVALKVLDIIRQENIIENSKTVGAYLHQELHKAFDDHPNVGEIRGQGLLAAIQLVKDKDRKTLFDVSEKVPAAMSKACQNQGLIARPLPSVGALALSPPLILSTDEADIIVNKMAAALSNLSHSDSH